MCVLCVESGSFFWMELFFFFNRNRTSPFNNGSFYKVRELSTRISTTNNNSSENASSNSPGVGRPQPTINKTAVPLEERLTIPTLTRLDSSSTSLGYSIYSHDSQVEAQGVALIDPSRHARELAADEEKAHVAHLALRGQESCAGIGSLGSPGWGEDDAYASGHAIAENR